ncbi:OLC1v1018937C1 [Oldenlandia corymbosa var. corymbosa]|uniref:OLC1v1018937C1 n=1 Tax=Oldenlandia corymbosa var. corymbosa TaxID=529605 RepID=A0AAV1ECS9_OLDCO|nr:OLC1v1018937C1 [Oldenlandia corymbosa var. corymbosa]
MGGAAQRLPLLRVILSCRKITAQVTNPITDSIIAMASTTEPEFIPQLKAKRNQVPRHHNYVDLRMASRVGEKLGVRLKEIGVENVEIDLKEELSRPIHQQKMVNPIFRTVKEAGISVSGTDELIFGNVH